MSQLISDTRSTTITLAAASAGPFEVGYRVFDAQQLEVYVNDLPTANFTLNAEFLDGYTDDATISFTSDLEAGDVIIIDADLVPGREENYIAGDPSFVDKLNIEQGRQWSAIADLRRDAKRALRTFEADVPKVFDVADTQANAAAAAASAGAAEVARQQIVAALDGQGFFLTPEMYGSAGDGDWGTNTGTDDSVAIAQMMAAAMLGGVPVQFNSVYYVADATALAGLNDITIVGNSFNRGLIVNMTNTQNAMDIGTGTRVSGFHVRAISTDAKSPDSGQANLCIGVTSGFFRSTDHPEISDFHIENMRLTRLRNPSGGGYAVGMVGNVCDGYVGHINDVGSPSVHSGMVLAHWGGKSTGGLVGDVISDSWHPREINIGPIHGERSHKGLTISSGRNIVQNGLLFSRASQQGLYITPGDDTDRESVHEAGSVGRGIKVLGPIVGMDLQDEDSDDFVSIFCNGTSLGAIQAGETTIARQDVLPMDVEIGPITVIGSPNANKRIFNAQQFAGNLTVGTISCVDCEGAVDAVSVSNSYGHVNIAGVFGTFALDPINISRSSNVTIGQSKVVSPFTELTTDRVVYVVGDTEATAVSEAFFANDTEIDVDPVLSMRVMPGQEISVNGEIVRATAYSPIGAKRIFCTPLPSALSANDPVVIDHRPKNINLNVDTEGGHYGVDILSSFVSMTGCVERAGRYGLRARTASVVDLNNMHFSGNGVERAVLSSLTTADLQIPSGFNRVTMTGGSLGRDASYTEYNLIAATAETDHVRFVGVGVKFLGNITDEVTASSPNDYELSACTDKTGALLV